MQTLKTCVQGLTRWQYLLHEKVKSAILDVWRHVQNPTPSVGAYLLEEQSCQISSRSDL